MVRHILRVLSILGLSFGAAAAADTDSIQKFHDAVQIGDVASVRTMLAADPSLATSVDEFKFQPIHLLDMYFDPEILNLLLANGADINAKNDDGITILHIVTEPEAIAVLVGKGADIEARDNKGETPLIVQAGEQQNGPDVVAALLAQGADPNARDNSGNTALSIARRAGDDDLVALLARNTIRK